ncbi:MAG: BatD family protein [Thiopseudomonas sp.]|nr:BatD family protein [Thiopseudomonas sp.]MCK9465018.1 BatD family protein [Thiopseudomonas sp.]
MRIFLLALLFASQWLLGSYALAFTFSAQTDRQQLFLGESLELTLELDDLSYFVEPDISTLKLHFELLSSQRNSSTKNGTEPVQQWVFKLLPKVTGELEIPPITLGKYSSSPISIQVKSFLAPKTLALEPVYMDSQVDTEQVYLQAQVILTLRIYHSIPLYASGQLSTLSMPDARVEPLGKPRSFEQFINGVRHGVIEIRYAIFPQKTGQLIIPALEFSATLTGHDPSSLEPPRNLPGQQVQVYSAQIPLEVMPPPAQFPSDAIWLPAQALQLEQQWSPEQAELNTEQALTRTVLMRIYGQPSSTIPALLPQQQDNFHSYANPVQKQQIANEQGIVSIHHEQLALVGENSGHYEIPAIRLPWWNTVTNQLEYAELPAHFVQIKPKKQDLNLSDIFYFYKDLILWQITSAVFALTSLLFFLLWRHARRQPAVINSSSANNARLIENLKRACKSNEPILARAALDALARNTEFTPNAAAKISSNFHTALTELNAVLYTETEQQWHGKNLWQAFSDLNSLNTPQDNATLPPLYPP